MYSAPKNAKTNSAEQQQYNAVWPQPQMVAIDRSGNSLEAPPPLIVDSVPAGAAQAAEDEAASGAAATTAADPGSPSPAATDPEGAD